jgi:hypothetical protein
MNTQSWISFHSYIPNWYVAENNFFYSGLNQGCDLEALAINEVPIPITTTTTTSTTIPPPPTTTTTTTTLDCRLAGTIAVVNCDLAGTAVRLADCEFVINTLEITTTTSTSTSTTTTTTTAAPVYAGTVTFTTLKSGADFTVNMALTAGTLNTTLTVNTGLVTGYSGVACSPVDTQGSQGFATLSIDPGDTNNSMSVGNHPSWNSRQITTLTIYGVGIGTVTVNANPQDITIDGDIYTIVGFSNCQTT